MRDMATQRRSHGTAGVDEDIVKFFGILVIGFGEVNLSRHMTDKKDSRSGEFCFRLGNCDRPGAHNLNKVLYTTQPPSHLE